jgi:hypothetical protein
MRILRLHRVLPCLLLVLIGAAAPASRPAVVTPVDVIRIARSFPDGGGYSRQWKGSGTCEEIRHDGQLVLAKGSDGTYCCGFTFTVVMEAAEEFGLLEGKTIDQVKRFQKEWYGASSDKTIAERQVAVAVEQLGIGQAVKPDDAVPGDFLQFWRTKSGHSVIFLGWVERDGKRVGFQYRSSQGSTGGVGDNTP